MIIGINSIFRRLPAALEDQEARFLDGIRFSIEIADLAYDRLCATCARLADHQGMDPEHKAGDLVSALSDGWLIIDATYRLGVLLRQAPAIEHRGRWPELRCFQERATQIEPLRHAVQHLDQHIRESLDQKFPIWGTLSWLSAVEGGSPLSWVLVPGRMTEGPRRYVNPSDRVPRFSGRVAELTLATETTSVCLTDVMESIERVAKILELALDEAFSSQIREVREDGSDYLICLKF